MDVETCCTSYLIKIFIYAFIELSSKHLHPNDSKDQPEYKTDNKYIGYRWYCFNQGIYDHLKGDKSCSMTCTSLILNSFYRQTHINETITPYWHNLPNLSFKDFSINHISTVYRIHSSRISQLSSTLEEYI